MLRCWIAFTGFVFVCSASAALAQDDRGLSVEDRRSIEANWYPRSYAVVVGIDEYPRDSEWPRLSYAVSDAKMIAEVLEEHGFVVKLLLNEGATASAISSALQDEVRDKIGENDRFVFYFGGHGQSFEAPGSGTTLGYLIPYDGKRIEGRHRVSTYLSMEELRSMFRDFVPARHKMVVADACFSGLLAQRSAPEPEAILAYLGKTGTTVVTAGDTDQPVQDGAFSRILAEGLEGNADFDNNGYIDMYELGKYLRDETVKQYHGRQHPFVGNLSGTGQMVFKVAQLKFEEREVEVRDVPDVSKYERLAKEAEAKEQERLAIEAAAKKEYAKALEKAWKNVKEITKKKQALSKEDRGAVVDEFLSDFAADNPHEQEARRILSEIEQEADDVHVTDRRFESEHPGMVLIPAGEFMMGCNSKKDSSCDGDESPYHEVYLDAYYIDVHEVTLAEYAKCVKAGKCEKPGDKSDWEYCNWGYSDRDDHPVNCVNWNQAKAYCEWAGKKRLPTEAEWEKAARGTDGRIWPWGNSEASCEYAVMSDGGDGCGKDGTWPVCSKLKGNSPYGLCDMAGNVWEWVSDWYGGNYYSDSPGRNPQGPSSGSARVLRGGSWFSGFPEFLRASYRSWFDPVFRWFYVGFRCVVSSQ